MKKKPKNILIATGGTGGHIFPALALAEQLEKTENILFIGSGLDTNRFFDRSAFPYRSISSGSFVVKSPWKVMKSLTSLARGFLHSRKIIQEFCPDLVVGFGSYHTFPSLLAARQKGVPYILHEANSIPGKVNRFFSSKALVTGIHFPHAASLLKGNTKEVGMPLRNHLCKELLTGAEARDYFQLSHDLPVILVFGGSQGAQRMNHLFLEAALQLRLEKQFQVLHFTGDSSSAETFKKDYELAHIHACVKPFEEHMNYAWRAADIMVSRSGAGTIAEQIEYEVPGILIPYPHAADNHQEINADFLIETIGGGMKLKEKHLTSIQLSNAIQEVMGKSAGMRARIQKYKEQKKKMDLFTLVKEFLE